MHVLARGRRRPLGKGPRYQILSHVFARCASQTFRVRFSHVRVFSDSRKVQKSVTQIIYLRPLPIVHSATAATLRGWTATQRSEIMTWQKKSDGGAAELAPRGLSVQLVVPQRP